MFFKKFEARLAKEAPAGSAAPAPMAIPGGGAAGAAPPGCTPGGPPTPGLRSIEKSNGQLVA